MTKVKYSGLLGDHYLDEAYGNDFHLDVNKSGTKATFEDLDHHTKIVLSGENIEDGLGGLVSGTVDKITFTTKGGDVLATVDGDFQAKSISSTLFHKGVYAATELIFNGNDTFTGSGGDDFMWGFGGNDKLSGGEGYDVLRGGAGRDVLIGGGDYDVFMFATGDGKDVIKDFDASGGHGHQDLLYIPEKDQLKFTIESDKHGDAMLVFDSGDTLTLEGVAAKQLSADDFYPV
jgi:Ca2+-binding RTX toxin-like protein